MFNFILVYSLLGFTTIILFVFLWVAFRMQQRGYRRGFIPTESKNNAKMKFTCRKGKSGKYY